MAWLYLFVAGLFEVGWAIGLKYTQGFTRLVPTALTLASMVVSRVGTWRVKPCVDLRPIAQPTSNRPATKR